MTSPADPVRLILESEQRVLDDIELWRRTWPEARQTLAAEPDFAKFAADPGPERFLVLALLNCEVESHAVASFYVVIVRQAAASWVARAKALLDGAQPDQAQGAA